MKTHNTILIILALALATLSPIYQSQSAEPAERKKMMEENMMEYCQSMKEQKEKMAAEVKLRDAELTAQVAEMNAAPEGRKIALLATVVTRMVEQRITMNARKAQMEEEMMKHMMQHMQMSKESMAKCPMMKGMKGMDEKSAGDHKAHQPEQK